MRIGLVDVDGHNFPNLPMMKLSAWHKSVGDRVEWCDPLFGRYDKVYMSKVFGFTPDFKSEIRALQIVKGGTGYGTGGGMLDPEVEAMYPDYSLYGIADTAYGFLSRGCPRNCSFCVVTKKEGAQSRKVADLDQFWRGQKTIKLLDPNLLACRDHLDLLAQLAESRAWIDFTQGLTSKNTAAIKRLKVKILHFAWDAKNDSDLIVENLKRFKEIMGFRRHKVSVYVLTNFDTELDFDLHRVDTLRELGCDPYVMIYDKHKLPRGHVLTKLQRWVNCKRLFAMARTFDDDLKGQK